jgi:hypothetical protein
MGAIGNRAEVAVVDSRRAVQLGGKRVDEGLDIAHRTGHSITSTPAEPGLIIG